MGKELDSLHQYLVRKFKLYVDLKIDHDEEIDGQVIHYHAKQNRYSINKSDNKFVLRTISWQLKEYFHIKNPNARQKWIKV